MKGLAYVAPHGYPNEYFLPHPNLRREFRWLIQDIFYTKNHLYTLLQGLFQNCNEEVGKV